MKRQNSLLTLLTGIFLGVVLFFAALTILPLIPRDNRIANKTRQLSNCKSIATTTLIYAGDYDDRLPNASSMATFRALLRGHKDHSPKTYRDIENHSTAPSFNFNLAGVKTNPLTTISNLSSKAADLSKTPMVYSYLNSPKQLGWIIAHVDGSAKYYRETKLTVAELFAPQFDRAGTTLAPADYLADQDPLATK